MMMNALHPEMRAWRYIIVGLALAAVVVLSPSGRLQAQNRWSVARPIPDYADPRPPHMVADQQRTVHAFYSESTGAGGQSAVFYRRWSLAGGWTAPVDILLPPRVGVVQVHDVFMDQNGVIHLALFAGQPGVEGTIYYSQAPAAEADRARSWSRPRSVGDAAGPAASSALQGDPNGNLYLVYSGQREGIGIYESHSQDGGQTWSNPRTLFLTFKQFYTASNLNVILDPQGGLHAVWCTFMASGLGAEVYYARLNEIGGQWSVPMLLAEADPGDLAVDSASIVAYQGEIFVMYMDGAPPPTRFIRRSADGGHTWSPPVRPFAQVGGHGEAIFLTDSNNNLHLVFANRVGNPEISGMWHTVWLGERWGGVEMMTPRTPEQAVALGSYREVEEAHSPQAVVSQGNVLLATWWHNMQEPPPAGFAYTILDVPELPVAPLPTIAAASASLATATAPPAPVMSAQTPFQAAGVNTDPPPSRDPAIPLVAGLVPVMMLIVLASVIVLQRQNKHAR